MRRILMLRLVIVVGVLLVFVSAASANRLSVSNRNIRLVWNKLNFTDPSGEVVNIECDVTSEGSMHTSTITKTRGALVGYITRVPQPQNCVGGSATILQETLPWHIRYDSFTGSLPRPSGTRLQGVLISFRLNVGFTCLYRSTATEPVMGIVEIEANGLATGMRADETVLIPRAEGSIFCPASGRFRNVGRLTLLGATTNISVRLI